MRRVTSRAFLLGGAGFVLFVVYCWLRRLGQDLSWDESLNLEIYARHPFAALGLYREPNNHLLDSLFKSLFYIVPDLKTPFFYRLPNFIYITFYLYAAFQLCRDAWRRGAPLAAGILGTMLISASLIQWQMYNMRGYLAGIVVGLWGLRYLINKCTLFDDEVTMLDRRGTWGVAIFLTLLHAAVPTNAHLGRSSGRPHRNVFDGRSPMVEEGLEPVAQSGWTNRSHLLADSGKHRFGHQQTQRYGRWSWSPG